MACHVCSCNMPPEVALSRVVMPLDAAFQKRILQPHSFMPLERHSKADMARHVRTRRSPMPAHVICRRRWHYPEAIPPMPTHFLCRQGGIIARRFLQCRFIPYAAAAALSRGNSPMPTHFLCRRGGIIARQFSKCQLIPYAAGGGIFPKHFPNVIFPNVISPNVISRENKKEGREYRAPLFINKRMVYLRMLTLLPLMM